MTDQELKEKILGLRVNAKAGVTMRSDDVLGTYRLSDILMLIRQVQVDKNEELKKLLKEAVTFAEKIRFTVHRNYKLPQWVDEAKSLLEDSSKRYPSSDS